MTPHSEAFISFVRARLAQNGFTSLGKISAAMLGDWHSEFEAAWQACEKAKKPKAVRKAVPRTAGPENQIPPTLEMVQARIAEMGYTFKADRLIAHYTANGWKVGKVPMVNWHAACTTFQGDEPRRNVGASRSHPAFSPAPSLPEPANWREIIADDPEDGMMCRDNWATMLPFYRNRISRKCAGVATPPPISNLFAFPRENAG